LAEPSNEKPGDPLPAMRPPRPLLLIVAGFVSGSSYGAPPSELEQYLLELINRARADPAAEVSRLSHLAWDGTPDLNEGIPPGSISDDPKPPIALDPRLTDAAVMNNIRETDDLQKGDDLPEHIRLLPEGFLVDEREIPATFPLRALAENFESASPARLEEHVERQKITRDRSDLSVPRYLRDVEIIHETLFLDVGTGDRSRRRRLMDPDWNLMGLSFGLDAWNRRSGFGISTLPFIATQSFVDDPSLVCVTGVVFHDANGNGFYDVGESAGSLNLTITHPSGTIAARGRTFPSGGYTIPFAGHPAGTYRLVVTDATGAAGSVDFVWAGNRNVKADIIDPPLTADVVVDPPFLLDMTGGFTPGSQRGANQGGVTVLTRELRARRSITIHATLHNGGFSKGRFNLTMATRLATLHTLEIHRQIRARGVTLRYAGPVRVNLPVIVQTQETIRLSSRIQLRNSRDSRRSNLRRTFGENFAVRGFYPDSKIYDSIRTRITVKGG
jgi:hypothetical protein